MEYYNQHWQHFWYHSRFFRILIFRNYFQLYKSSSVLCWVRYFVFKTLYNKISWQSSQASEFYSLCSTLLLSILLIVFNYYNKFFFFQIDTTRMFRFILFTLRQLTVAEFQPALAIEDSSGTYKRVYLPMNHLKMVRFRTSAGAALTVEATF